MQPITITVPETAGIARKQETVQIGVPIAQNQLFKEETLKLCCPASGNELACQITPLGYWKNGTVRWLKIIFQTDLGAHETKSLILKKAENPNTPSPIEIEISKESTLVDTGKIQICLSNNLPEWSVKGPEIQNYSITSRLIFTQTNDNALTIKLNNPWRIEAAGSVSITLSANGECIDTKNQKAVKFEITLHCYSKSSQIKSDITIHNPNRAQHNNGLWDLGDSGSLTFNSMELVTSGLENSTTTLSAAPDSDDITTTRSLKLYQDSSGGENWQSINHVDRHGKISTKFRGYKIFEEDKMLAQADRANPIMRYHSNTLSISGHIENFWQNFPKAIGSINGSLVLSLFPEQNDREYELQGGEKKTHSCFIDYSSTVNSLDWARSPLTATLDSEQYERARAFPWFKANQPKSKLDELIETGINGEGNFFHKREIIDEYGWRNYGDIFADHETLYQEEGESPLISHYNNQYDAILGLARQFCLTGDKRWFRLMDDLAKHVTDIDIYHTTEDRIEYNGGLFWHTDHYLPAHTATHRTFTQHNSTSSTPGQTGGGPGDEHCYTTGLLYHYWMTGNEHSRDAVISLANWKVSLHEGRGGLLEQILMVKKKDFPNIKALLKKEKPTTHEYAFTRATGNYINTLLDTLLLTGDKEWLERAERVIEATIHPKDNIEKRNLLVVETSWSYLILLQSIVKYLQIKEERQEFDTRFQYALTSFVRYARWIAQNERPFLNEPDQLEFNNHTWIAQDLRKAILMYQSAYYDEENSKQYLNKTQFWLNYVCSSLSDSKEAHFSRILIILMQNYSPMHTNIGKLTKDYQQDTASSSGNAPLLTWKAVATRIGARLVKGLLSFRPSKEIDWIKVRKG